MLSLAEFVERLEAEAHTFNALIERHDAESKESLRALSLSLTRLLELGELCPDSYAESDLEPPDEDQRKLRERIQSNFPTFGTYFVVKPNEEKTYVAAAIDDVMDIWLDLNRAVWHLREDDPANGAWYAKLMFCHWGEHAINLKRCLHQQIYDW